jgi:hypothetical protein
MKTWLHCALAESKAKKEKERSKSFFITILF